MDVLTGSSASKAAETKAFNAQLLREDAVSLYRRGATPLTIATMLKRSEPYVLSILLDAGEKIPRWLRNDLESSALGRHDGNEIPSL